MQATLRESIVGQFLNKASNGRILPYPEQRPDFVVPEHFLLRKGDNQKITEKSRQATPPSSQTTRCPSPTSDGTPRRAESDTQTLTDATAERIGDKLKHPQNNALEEGKDRFLVGWYSEDDPENPQNWSKPRKTLLMSQMMLLTFAMYVGSAIYTPSVGGVSQAFGVSQTKAILGLSLYVLAYGMGPMVLSPLSEIPRIGRLNVYMVSAFIFMILQIPTALAPNYATLMAMRFFGGFVCSPALSTGGATLSDVFSPMVVPYVVAGWASGAVLGPVIGPVASGYAAQEENWRWPLFMLLFISVFSFISLAFLFPETSSATILLRRAQRLRKLTGNNQLRSQSEIDSAGIKPKELISTSLLRPFLLLRDPAVLFVDVYIALVYAIFYLWFEAFPIVFGAEGYAFNLGGQSLPFVGFVVALIPTLLCYFAYQKYSVIPEFKRTGVLIPESRLKVALFGSFIPPIALLWFGWSAQERIHWIMPIIGASLYLPGIFLIFQGAIVYLPLSYGQYAASVLAGNALLRGITGAVFPLFGHALFQSLGIGGGSSLLAGLSIIMIPPLFLLYKYGAKLRGMSKYATS